MQQKRNTCRALVRKPAEKRPPGRPEDGNILKWILRQRGLRVWTLLMWFRTRKSGGLLWTWWWTSDFL